MGLDFNGIRFLLYARTQGVDFARTAMIGRQELHTTEGLLEKCLKGFGYSLTRTEIRRLFADENRYAEPLLRLLGANEIRSLDASAYEGATDIHDFNLPVHDSVRNRFTVVLDGGSLEHIFNFPVAIKNCMEMIRLGGHFISISPANNFMGHGFYQFSPELFFRIFGRQNGFELITLIIFENVPVAGWLEVTDPAALNRRVTLVNSKPTYLAVIGKKVSLVPILATNPQQSDYLALWHSHGKSSQSHWVRSLKLYAPQTLRSLYRSIDSIVMRLRRYDRRFFRPIHFR